jgi:hypothetical protein
VSAAARRTRNTHESTATARARAHAALRYIDRTRTPIGMRPIRMPVSGQAHCHRGMKADCGLDGARPGRRSSQNRAASVSLQYTPSTATYRIEDIQ